MTEKRFRKVLVLIEDSNGDLLDLSEITDKMNQLNNENEQLKETINEGCLGKLKDENKELKEENKQLKQFKENVINWVDSQMKFNVKKYIETEHDHFKCENIDLHNFKVEMGID